MLQYCFISEVEKKETHRKFGFLQINPVALPVDPVDDSNLPLDVLPSPDHHNPVSRGDMPERNAVFDLDEGRVLTEVSRDGGATELASAVGRRVQVGYCALEGAGEVARRHLRDEKEGGGGGGERTGVEELCRCLRVLLSGLVAVLKRS